MQVVTYSSFRKNLKSALDQVTDDGELVIINRSENKNVVLLSLNEYNAIQETLHLLSTENNRERLLKAVERSKKNLHESHDLIED